jgi:hypothetical protein
MSEPRRGWLRALTRLLESYAPARGSCLIIQTIYGCDVVHLPVPQAQPDTTDDNGQRPLELNWHWRDGNWQLNGHLLPPA